MNKILVIGDIIIDHYIYSSCDRISPEAPVPVAKIIDENFILGGASNVARNIAAFNYPVELIGLIGDDDNGKRIINLIKKNKHIENNIVIDKNRPTTIKSRLISKGQQIIRIDKEEIFPVNPEITIKITESLKSDHSKYSCVVVSDYGKGFLTDAFLSDIMNLCKKRNIKVLVDPKGKNFKKYRGAFLLTPNKKELSDATGIQITDDDSIKRALKVLKNLTNSSKQLVTLSEKGIALLEDNNLHKFNSEKKQVFDVTGAGDTVIAAIAYKLSKNENLANSIVFANRAAGIVVGKIGAAVATLDEIYEKSIQKKNIYRDLKNLMNVLMKNKHQKFVFTNGCFDIIHKGHITYLEEASKMGEILIVGLNSDESVRKLKGPNRPINNEDDRAKVLSSLSSVDYIIIFEENDPYNLIKELKPSVLVKGGDYEIENVIGHDLVDKTVIIDFVEDLSTTNIINKIKSLKNE